MRRRDEKVFVKHNTHIKIIFVTIVVLSKTVDVLGVN